MNSKLLNLLIVLLITIFNGSFFMFTVELIVVEGISVALVTCIVTLMLIMRILNKPFEQNFKALFGPIDKREIF